VKLEGFELRRIGMPLVGPFRTSFGVETHRDILLVRAVTPDSEGWGECVAMSDPLYSSEHVHGAQDVIKRFMLPMLFGAELRSAYDVARVLEPIKEHRMAKAVLETAILDADLRASGVSLGSHLGATRDKVECGVSVGITDSIPKLLDQVDDYIAQGYCRIKLKIQPGWDVEPVKAVRERIGDVRLQVDANTAYTLADADQLAKLDPFDLLLIEQPLREDNIPDHAKLAQRVRTPICLDESITSARVAIEAISMGACAIINIKPGRVGGYLEARRIHDACEAMGVPVWAGGMLESGIGRAANVALAALPNFSLPGDTSASSRYFAQDVTEPFVLDDGYLSVPSGPGIGISPLPDVLEEITTSTEWISA
jgi:O-succinylbenzoate synthase